ncbi:folate-binding protein YgfZ [Drepanopeziza brunnea f. sp. 'multigermtubi' MB_m1]|uniref:Iron-sulfur cluster assembly factor IBA57 homolog, mitochondrial n=1 Tax=Marssonina brunnea f. sp. multigermtubi (strain MB_m1) TaxID=1072389 RepID=K1X5P7_MARBU|nr:folate-binding protein YgfZ [Drepanopeziza brunnea f. sp. 'multigermtubi' MB_m1]EKD20447.1 folate-binding protein YgfZ [Drepanopeziza brunnea f. sp. 'multigermtubi' MB_m1]
MKSSHAILRILSQSPISYICSNCLSRTLSLATKTTRLYSTSTSSPPSKPPPSKPPPSAAYAHLSNRRLIALTGPDSTHYLQGVITANLSPNAPRTSGFYAAFLNASGRLLNDVFVYPYVDGGGGKYGAEGGGGWLIEVDAKEVDVLAKHIRRYRLRSRFEVRVLEVGERGVWSLWADGNHDSNGNSDGDFNGNGRNWTKGVIGCEDSRAPGMGRRVLLPGDRKPEADREECTEEVYRLRRYLKGVPEGQDELVREQALPQESNVDYMGGIDYRKGCYVGQELTIRTHHRGVVRKRILPVMIYGVDEKEPEVLQYLGGGGGLWGAESIPRETGIGRWEKKGRSAGKFLVGLGNVGLGLCRLETMTDVQLAQGEGISKGEGDEFKLEWEQEGEGRVVKVKAFVPTWHLARSN